MESPSHPVSSLIALPEELLTQIATYLDRNDLRSFLYTSKVTSRASLPYLYEYFSHELYRRPQDLHLFIRSIIMKPDLAIHVKRIDLRDQERCDEFKDLQSWRTWAEDHYHPELSMEDHELFLAAAHDSRFVNVEDVISKLPFEEEAQVMLLIHLAVNLGQLQLTMKQAGTSEDDRLLLQLIQETVEHRTALQHLHTFVPSYYNFEGQVDGGFLLSPISYLFRLPSLRTVRGSACLEPDSEAFGGFHCPAGASAVEDIDFRRSAICPKALRVMIEACRGLKKFSCDWGSSTVGWAEINWPHLATALRTQAHSLEKLMLDTRKHRDHWPERDEILIPPLGSLKMMEKLRCIQVPGSALIGFDENQISNYDKLHEILPPSIETLVVNAWAPEIHENLKLLADVCRTIYPRMRTVALIDDERTTQEVEEAIAKRFREKTDVTFIFESDNEVDHWS